MTSTAQPSQTIIPTGNTAEQNVPAEATSSTAPKFMVTGLTLSGGKVAPGEDVSIMARVINIGNVTGKYTAQLIVNNEVKDR
jgi:hypothetical protein